MTDSTNNPHYVNIGARTVPADRPDGRGSNQDLKVSLCLSPEVAKATSVQVPFHQWPSFVDKNLRKSGRLKLRISPIKANTTSLPTPKTCVWEEPIEMTPWTDADPDFVEIDSLWQHVMPMQAGEGFGELGTQLDAYVKFRDHQSVTVETKKPTVVCNGAGQIVQLSQLEKALVQLAETSRDCLDGRYTRLENLVLRALAQGREFIEEAKLSFPEVEEHPAKDDKEAHTTVKLPKNEDGDPEELESNRALSAHRQKEAQNAMLEACKEETHAAVGTGALLSAENKIADCLACLEDGSVGGSCAPGLVLRSFEEILDSLMRLQQLNLLASSMGVDEAAALEATFETKEKPKKSEYQAPAGPLETKNIGLISARLEELQENSEFGRLFQMTLDFRVSYKDVLRAAQGAIGKDVFGQDCAFLYVQIIDDLIGETPIFDESYSTLSKLTFDESGSLSFLPTTREEALIFAASDPLKSKEHCEFLSQANGVRMLTSCGAKGKGPRHEFSVVDPRDAAQDLDNRLSQLYSFARFVGKVPEGSKTPITVQDQFKEFKLAQTTDSPWPLAASKSRALRLFHFHENDAIARQVGAASIQTGLDCTKTSLDANDLSLGLLFDLSARQPTDTIKNETSENVAASLTPRRDWRPLSISKVIYSDPRKRSDRINGLDDLIQSFFRDEQERARYQRATNGLMAQTKDIEEKGERTPIVVADELIFTFEGDQVGADDTLENVDWTQKVISSHAKIDRCHQIDINRKFVDPFGDKGSGSHIWPLEFGLGYFGGARDVYVGGGSLRDEQAHRLFDTVPIATVPKSVPCKNDTRLGFRFTRPEKISAPMVLLDSSVVQNRPGFYSRPFMPNTTTSVTLRSKGTFKSKVPKDKTTRDIEYSAQWPKAGERLVIVPGLVDMEFAQRHGVFRGADILNGSIDNRPIDGLASIDFSNKFGGWPTLTDRNVAFGNDTVLIEREANDTASGGKKRAASNAVFQKKTTAPKVRKSGLYPEPFHDALVLRLRRAGSYCDWVGKPLVIKTPASAYPDPTPISLRIKHGKKGKPLFMRQASKTTRIFGAECEEVEIELPPGQYFELVSWSLPSLPKFAMQSDFVALQAAQAISFYAAGKPNANDDYALLEELIGSTGTIFAPDPNQAEAGVGGQTAPNLKQLMVAAKYFHEKLSEVPLASVGGHSTIQLRHAVDRPTQAPIPQQRQHDNYAFDNPILVRRSLGLSCYKNLPALVSEPGPIDADFCEGQDPLRNAQAGGLDVDLAGFIEIDPFSTETVEVFASAVNPLEGTLDTNRKRSPRHVRDGIFDSGKIETVFQRNKNSDQLEGNVARRIYGFNVATDERVKFPETKFLLARFTDIPPWIECEQTRLERANLDLNTEGFMAPKAYLALHRLFELASNLEDSDADGSQFSTVENIRADVRPVLAFPQAREIKLSFRAISRHIKDMSTRPIIVDGVFRPETPPEPDDIQSEFELGQSLWVPASERPSAPARAAKAITVFKHSPARITPETKTISVERRQSIRLSFARPFFTSGEGEKLGIILSPRPSRFGTDGGYDRESMGLLSEPNKDYRLMERFLNPRNVPAELVGKLTKFAGKADRPYLAMSNKEKGPYGLYPVPLPLFRDFEFDILGKLKGVRTEGVGYVADAQLPIHVESDRKESDAEAQEGRDDGRDPPQAFFPVDLLTYEPRFDIARELWYVDVGIDPRKTLEPYLELGAVCFQPNAPRDLQVSNVGDAITCRVLPARCTTVRMEPKAENKVGIHVMITGLSEGEWSTQEGKESNVTDDSGPKSYFEVRIWAQEKAESKLTIAHEYQVKNAKLVAGKLDQRKASFELSERFLDTYSVRVVVEEREIRRTTTPVEGLSDDVLSGPLYQETIELPSRMEKS